MFDKFSERHIGVSNEKELKAMLETIGVKSVDELISQVIPHSIRLKKPLALPAEGMSEYEFAGHIRALAERNRCLPPRNRRKEGMFPTGGDRTGGTARRTPQKEGGSASKETKPPLCPVTDYSSAPSGSATRIRPQYSQMMIFLP